MFDGVDAVDSTYDGEEAGGFGWVDETGVDGIIPIDSIHCFFNQPNVLQDLNILTTSRSWKASCIWLTLQSFDADFWIDLSATPRETDTSFEAFTQLCLLYGFLLSIAINSSLSTVSQQRKPPTQTIPSSFSLLRCSLLALSICLGSTTCLTPNHGVLTGLGPVYIKTSYKNAPNAHPRTGATIGTQK